jgi:hypothetical protein
METSVLVNATLGKCGSVHLGLLTDPWPPFLLNLAVLWETWILDCSTFAFSARARFQLGFRFPAKSTADIRSRFSCWSTAVSFCEHLRILDSRFTPPQSTVMRKTYELLKSNLAEHPRCLLYGMSCGLEMFEAWLFLVAGSSLSLTRNDRAGGANSKNLVAHTQERRVVLNGPLAQKCFRLKLGIHMRPGAPGRCHIHVET